MPSTVFAPGQTTVAAARRGSAARASTATRRIVDMRAAQCTPRADEAAAISRGFYDAPVRTIVCIAAAGLRFRPRSVGELFGGDEARLDVDGDVLQAIEDLLNFGAHYAELVEQLLGARAIAVRLQRHQLAGERGDAVFDLGRVDGERAARIDLERARVDQEVELQRLPLAVRLADAEADRAERRRQERHVHRALQVFRQDPF